MHNVDSEVYYTSSYENSLKPFVGIIIILDKFHYFVPLTSAKPKHIYWKNVSNSHFLIYEYVEESINIRKQIYKPSVEGKKIHILSVLDFKKMIPVPPSEYNLIDFNNLEYQYRRLLQKEYDFCKSLGDKIIKRIEKMYSYQKETGIIKRMHCDFLKLERACQEYVGK